MAFCSAPLRKRFSPLPGISNISAPRSASSPFFIPPRFSAWGQNLLHHPHIHCVVPGGGLSPDQQRLVSCRPGFFLPVRVPSRLFRRLFLDELEKVYQEEKLQFFGELNPLKDPSAFARYLAPWREREWVVYAKPPFGGPQQVLEYLGRYTHKVAISHQRLLRINDGEVTFQWKDYRQRDKQKSALCRKLLAHPITELLPDAMQCLVLLQVWRGRVKLRPHSIMPANRLFRRFRPRS